MSVVAPALRAAAAAVRRLRLASSGGRVAWRRVGPGLWMVIDPGDAMDQRFMLGIYDPGLLLLLRDLVRPGDSALDVGAHCGYVTLHLARQVGPTGSVAAVEPDPRARDRLIEHLARNGFNHVAVIEAALGDGPGEAVLHLSRQVGWSTRFPNPTARPTLEGELRVRVHSLDGLARQGTLGLDLARLVFVKVDCEGSEPLVLAGMRETLRATSPAIWIELNRGALAAAGSRPESLVDALREMGFDVWLPRFFRRALGQPDLRFEPIAGPPRPEVEVFDVLALRPESPAAGRVRHRLDAAPEAHRP